MARGRHRRPARGVRRRWSRRRGPPRRARWYWRQALPLAARFAASRIVPAMAPPRRRRVARRRHRADEPRSGRAGRAKCATRWRALRQRPALTRGRSSARWPWRWPPMPSCSTWPTRSTCARSASPTSIGCIVVASDTSVDKPYLDRESVAAGRLPRLAPQRVTTVSELAAARVVGPELLGRRAAGAGCLASGSAPGYLRAARRAAAHRPDASPPTTAARRHPRGDAVARALAAALQRRSRHPRPTLRLDGEPHEVIGVMPPRFVDSLRRRGVGAARLRRRRLGRAQDAAT